jgi:hypothetical protein
VKSLSETVVATKRCLMMKPSKYVHVAGVLLAVLTVIGSIVQFSSVLSFPPTSGVPP